MDQPNQHGKRNRLLALLPEQEYEQLMAHAVLTSLVSGQELYRAGAAIESVYLPLDCVVSIVVNSGSDEPTVEMATVGNEGMIGVSSVLHVQRAIGTHVTQVAGEALQIPLPTFNRFQRESPQLDDLLHRYIYAFMRLIVQAAACTRLHTMVKRCARWLLMMHDRAERNPFPLTQEFLAEMLAVRRATVNVAIGALRRAGLIRYVRGKITIVNRRGLESAACPCYELIRKEYEELRLDQRAGDAGG